MARGKVGVAYVNKYLTISLYDLAVQIHYGDSIELVHTM